MTIILACIYHYRHIEINLRCQCLYNDQSNRFYYHWSTDQIEYEKLLNDILFRFHSSLLQRSLEDQIETIIDEITKYFTRLKPIHQEQQSITIIRDDESSMEILKYERSPQSQRGQSLKRSSLLSSQPVIRRSMPNFHVYEKRV